MLHRRLRFTQASLDEKKDPISKIVRAKRAGDMAKAVQHLPTKHKALRVQNPSTIITKCDISGNDIYWSF
jgi:hypothetical protein